MTRWRKPFRSRRRVHGKRRRSWSFLMATTPTAAPEPPTFSISFAGPKFSCTRSASTLLENGPRRRRQVHGCSPCRRRFPAGNVRRIVVQPRRRAWSHTPGGSDRINVECAAKPDRRHRRTNGDHRLGAMTLRRRPQASPTNSASSTSSPTTPPSRRMDAGTRSTFA